MTARDDEVGRRLELALALAKEAGEITLEFFRRDNFEVENKPDDSPVTIADRRAEQHIRQRLGRAFPDDALLGEEFGEAPGTSGFRWIIDPIDGTKLFIHGVPLYGTLLGVEAQGRSVVGVIRIPALGECAYAALGQGAWYVAGNEPPRPARVGNCSLLGEALLCSSDVEGFAKVGRWETFEKLLASVRLMRTWGDCYGYLLVATGRADVMIDPRMSIWDAAALQPILEEAGGAFVDWQGEANIDGGNGIAANRVLVEQVVAITRRAPGAGQGR